jgi:ABC-2 type transport system ATP-binding protein
MLKLEGVAKRYGSVYALKDVSFSAQKGQVLGLLGQNGAGKTTALNILTGYLSATRGSVTIGGYDILQNPREAKRLMGYLPEQPPLYDEMSVESYLRFCCKLKEVDRKAIPGHVNEVLHTTSLDEVAGRKLGNLSKGFRQRAGIAQALCGAPELLILDEPTVGLDPKQVTEIRALIKKLGEKHTVVFSSHMLHEIQSLCRRVVILHQGRLIREADMEELTGNTGDTVRLRVSIQMKERLLLPSLNGLDCVQRTTVLPTQDADITEAILECRRDMQPETKLFTLLCGLQAPILRLAPMYDTLEEVFLQATSGAFVPEKKD